MNILIKYLFVAILSIFGIAYSQTSFIEMSSVSGIEDVGSIMPGFGHGISAADFDDDGDIDFYLTTGEGINDRLYVNDGKGQFVNMSSELGINNFQNNRSSLWIDINGDGLLDLVVAGESCAGRICKDPIFIRIFKQQIDHKFIEITSIAGLSIGSDFDDTPFFGVGGMAAGDLTGDGYLDLVMTVWGGGIKIWKNLGNDTFEDATHSLGFINNRQTYWQPMLHDFNQDGLLDIYCNVDFDSNKLWINKQDHFSEQAKEYGIATSFNEMGMAMGDYNNDGLLDIYMTNITRDFHGQPQYNILYKQERRENKITFREVGRGIGVSQSGWDWGCTFTDIDNDGRQDIATTNGWNHHEWHPDPSHIFHNTKGGFIDVASDIGCEENLSSTTFICFDKDRDGDLDMIQTLKFNEGISKPLYLYENQLKPSDFVTIQPRLTTMNNQAIGSQVILHTSEFESARLISAGCSFYGQEPAEAFYGLGQKNKINEVKIIWPGNQVMHYDHIEVNKVNKINHLIYLKAPTHLNAELLEANATLTWMDNSDNEGGFVIHKSNNENFRTYETFYTGPNVTTYSDKLDPNEKGYYRVRSFFGKSMSDNSNIVDVQYKDDQTTLEGIFIYPNPTIEKSFYIEMVNEYKGEINLVIVDANGRRIQNTTAKKEDISLKINMEMNDGMFSGVYMLGIQSGETIEWRKIFKQ